MSNVKQYRKKPIVIEAVLFNGENSGDIFRWAYMSKSNRKFSHVPKFSYVPKDSKGYEPFMKIETLEGTMIAKYGDYIIKGVQGEFYPCKPDIFNATYEAV